MRRPNTKAEFAQRLNHVCDLRGLPAKYAGRQNALARIFGVSQKGARKWLEAESLPTLEMCIAIAHWGNVALEWLLTGRGPQRPTALHLDQAAIACAQALQSIPADIREALVQAMLGVAAALAAQPFSGPERRVAGRPYDGRERRKRALEPDPPCSDCGSLDEVPELLHRR